MLAAYYATMRGMMLLRRRGSTFGRFSIVLRCLSISENSTAPVAVVADTKKWKKKPVVWKSNTNVLLSTKGIIVGGVVEPLKGSNSSMENTTSTGGTDGTKHVISKSWTDIREIFTGKCEDPDECSARVEEYLLRIGAGKWTCGDLSEILFQYGSKKFKDRGYGQLQLPDKLAGSFLQALQDCSQVMNQKQISRALRILLTLPYGNMTPVAEQLVGELTPRLSSIKMTDPICLSTSLYALHSCNVRYAALILSRLVEQLRTSIYSTVVHCMVCRE